MWSDGGPAQPVAHDPAGDQWRLAVAGGQMLAQWLKASCCGAKPIATSALGPGRVETPFIPQKLQRMGVVHVDVTV
jgi:hypothetical protein